MPENLPHHKGHHAERLAHSPEQLSTHDQEQKRSVEGETAEHDSLSESLDALRKRVETQAVSGKEISVDHGADKAGQQMASPASFGVHRQLKTDAYKRTLTKIQSHLPASERLFSRTIHNPVVENVSNVAAKTIGRPSGILGGSFFALAGTMVVLYLAKRTGFQYNFTVFFLLFMAGFLVGLIVECVRKLLTRKRGAY